MEEYPQTTRSIRHYECTSTGFPTCEKPVRGQPSNRLGAEASVDPCCSSSPNRILPGCRLIMGSTIRDQCPCRPSYHPQYSSTRTSIDLTLLSHVQLRTYFDVTAITITVYDYLLTLNDEVRTTDIESRLHPQYALSLDLLFLGPAPVVDGVFILRGTFAGK
ncbi:hypothetical protein QCA50_008861 [Cerrena zonata]|uniref:Uncharacterized protein n=1 Tax=Cerrena zonata TaxID=2478898 RepID=A0AAW0GDE3_9APHY